jgi:hypothetical protein
MTPSSRSTKECVSCFEAIDARARKCRHCAAIQARWANIDSNPWAMAVVAVMIVAVLGTMFYPILWRPRFQEYSQQLTVSVQRHSVDEADGHVRVTCLGTMDNQTGHDWSDFRFEVRLTGADGQLTDVFSASDNLLVAARGNSVAFRVQGASPRIAAELQACEVRVTHAKVL